MTSVGRTTAQISRATGYYVPLASLVGQIFAEPTVSANGTMTAFSTTAWAKAGGAAGKYLSSISSVNAGGLLRDMGKTLVSSGRTFRKIQLVVNVASGSTFGVHGDSGTAPNQDYFTGYIELGFGDMSVGAAPAPVAAFGR